MTEIASSAISFYATVSFSVKKSGARDYKYSNDVEYWYEFRERMYLSRRNYKP
jgi:hypothetical protein